MATTTLAPLEESLAGGSLPRWATPVVLVGSVAAAVALNITTGLAGWFGTSMVAGLIFWVIRRQS